MKKTYLLILLSMIIFSCDSDDEITEKDIYTYRFFENSELKINSKEFTYMKYGEIQNGEKLVFEYKFIADDEESIADDEYAETIMFEIDPNIDNFSYSDNELIDIKSVFTMYCFCYFSDDLTHKIVDPKGQLSGIKISDNEWDIKIDITFYGDDYKSIEKRFVLEEKH